jgi:hypothetical protein
VLQAEKRNFDEPKHYFGERCLGCCGVISIRQWGHRPGAGLLVHLQQVRGDSMTLGGQGRFWWRGDAPFPPLRREAEALVLQECVSKNRHERVSVQTRPGATSK